MLLLKLHFNSCNLFPLNFPYFNVESVRDNVLLMLFNIKVYSEKFDQMSGYNSWQERNSKCCLGESTLRVGGRPLK